MTTSSHVAGDGLPSGSASCISAAAVSGYHLLKIFDYSRTRELPNGECIESCPFRVGGRTWHVCYYPDGDKSKHTGYISLYLQLDDTVAKTEAVKAQANFSLLDQLGNPVPYYTQRTDTNNYVVDTSWGYGKFIRRKKLEKSDYLKDDSFIVKIEITIGDEFHVQETPSIVEPSSDMHLHFGDLLLSKAGADVEFQVGGETFSAHRLVLAARSRVFRAQFFGQMKEGTTTEAIHIDDMEAQVFDALLTFVYTDALPDMKQQEECIMAQHLLVAADRYDLVRLKLICQGKLLNHIDRSSVPIILALAKQHHCDELKAACKVFLSILTNLDAAMESEDFEFLNKSCPVMSHVAPSLLGKRKSKA